MTRAKSPPNDIPAEMGVLGAVLIRNAALDEVRPVLRAEDFYRTTHQKIFAAMTALADEGRAVDLITLRDRLGGDALENTGGLKYLDDIQDVVATSAYAVHHANIVREKARARSLLVALHNGVQALWDANADPDEVRAELTRRLDEVDERERGNVVRVADLVPDTIERARAAARGELPTCYPTGLAPLDELIGGLVPGRLIIVAGRPGMGKTALAVATANAVAESTGKAALVFSLEMTARDLTDRLVCQEARCSVREAFGGRIGPDSLTALARIGETVGHRVLVDERTRFLEDIGAVARSVARRERGLALVCVDYAQRVRSRGRKKDDPRLTMDEVSRTLADLAKDVDAPVMLLSQLNRLTEQRESKRPRMSELKESGGLEQDADVVLLLYREGYYSPNAPDPDRAEIIVAKNRHGRTGTAVVRWDGPLTLFTNPRATSANRWE
ncbi:MAG: replicative DNA helicase [Deltaproteobacteria bacterium]|nr:replicative DNA helicase [Deltaproteobacteria bacterium]